MVDVLNLEWMSYPARDRNMSSLVGNYLRYQGYSVVEESLFRGYEMIKELNPRLLFIANGIGASANFNIVKYASLKGIKVVTMVSEGNYLETPEAVETFLWGWNKDRYMYEDVNIHWSLRTKNLAISQYPSINGKIKVSGGCGFDIYRIRPNKGKNEFLRLYSKEKYEKTIGVGCWDFGYCRPDTPLSIFNKDEEIVKRFNHDRDLFNKVLLNIIESNPSILFILKEHPGNRRGLDMSGIDGAERFDNVLILKYDSIIDTIAASDIWLTYESTTVLEAWMLGKPTCLLNPTGIDFPRANVYLGSPNYPNEEALQNAIDVFYSTGELPGFNDQRIADERKKVIKDTIQWDDGLNHVRAGNEIIRLLESETEKKKSPIPMDIRINIIKQRIINLLKIKKSFIYQQSNSFKRDEVEAFSKELYEQQLSFYKSLGLSKEELRNYLPL